MSISSIKQVLTRPIRYKGYHVPLYLILFVFLIGSFWLISIFNPIIEVGWWESGNRSSPAWSPDGKKILYAVRKKLGPHQVVIIGRGCIFTCLKIPVDSKNGNAHSLTWRTNQEISFFLQSYRGRGTNNQAEPATMMLYDLGSKEYKAFEGPLPNVGGTAWNIKGDQALVSFQGSPLFTTQTNQPGIYRFTPADGKFVLWRAAEFPLQITWSPSGRLVAYVDLIQREEEKVFQLNVVSMSTNQTLASGLLSHKSPETYWTLYGDKGLSWSPDERWIILNGTTVEYQDTKHYVTQRVFGFVSVKNPEEVIFWKLNSVLNEFDLSPNGKRIVGTTVTEPWVGGNKLYVVRVPKEFW